jgi:hypothetical protein
VDAVANPDTIAIAEQWVAQYGLQVIDRVNLHRPTV